MSPWMLIAYALAAGACVVILACAVGLGVVIVSTALAAGRKRQ